MKTTNYKISSGLYKIYTEQDICNNVDACRMPSVMRVSLGLGKSSSTWFNAKTESLN